MLSLKEKFKSEIEPLRARVKMLIEKYGDVKISDVTVSQAYSGMRNVKCLVTETSSVDPNKGIRFRGYAIPELPKNMLPEGMFYLLLSGELPAKNDVEAITKEWQKRSVLPKYLINILKTIPKNTHPMTQFSLAILSLQKDSIFTQKYKAGMNKIDYWEPIFEDTMNLLAKLPLIAAYIYCRTYKNSKHIRANPRLDWGGNLAHMLGIKNEEFKELIRLYLVIHCDHEGGNVSAHTTHLVGSALSDAYYALSAGINGLAGPLHGLANQEVLRWIIKLMKNLGNNPTKEQLKKYVWDTLNAGQVIPGYGHAVLRQTDPRYLIQREFALKHFPDDKIFKITEALYEVVPDILKKHGKAKNPWPNVDALSGCLLYHYGIEEFDFYTVLFGVSRAIGVLSSLILDRAIGLSIERPKSITSEQIEQLVKKQ